MKGFLTKLWGRLSGRRLSKPIDGALYRVTSTLYSADGKRSAKIIEFEHGAIYLLEAEWAEGTTFRQRHGGNLVGPFGSPTLAEHFIIATAWFNGENLASPADR